MSFLYCEPYFKRVDEVQRARTPEGHREEAEANNHDGQDESAMPFTLNVGFV